ncbi:hypothetical protein [Nostoc sp. CCY 9925]|uniref:hypothetical protein n=1 Tax=Nostoc sp. CCY 9925 TaxID=3103865 RepID=UPI0039C645D5
MSNFPHSNNGSLFALEHSLFDNSLTNQTSKQFTDEQEQETPEITTQAFDVGEAITLEYQENTESDFESISRQYGEEDTEPETYTSRGFDLQSENIPTYDVEAFAVEDEEIPLLDNRRLAQSHSLFALEQSLFASSRKPQAHQFTQEAENSESDEPALSESHSLFALEQKVLKPTGENQTDWEFAIAQSQTQDIVTQAFDWDEAIALEYEASAYPTASAFDWMPTDESSHSFEDESLPFQVEDFTEQELQPTQPISQVYFSKAASEDNGHQTTDYTAQASYDNQAYGFDATPDVAAPVVQPSHPQPEKSEVKQDKPVNYAVPTGYYNQSYANETQEKAATPVEPVSSNKQPDSTPIPVVHPIVASPGIEPVKSAAAMDFDFDELENTPATDSISESKAFEADLEAILRGEKVYEPSEKAPTPTTPAHPSTAQSLPPKTSNPHDIFDQMGRSMTHATAFDLGTFSLEQTFDEFDRMLDDEEDTWNSTPKSEPIQTIDIVPETKKPKQFSGSLSVESDQFNSLLKSRMEFEKSNYGTWGRPQYRDFIGALTSNKELQALAVKVQAAPLLAKASEVLGDDTEKHPLFNKIINATDTLAHAAPRVVLDTAAVVGRLQTFASEVDAAVKGQEIPQYAVFKADRFNEILKERLQFEKSEYGAWGRPQYKDFLKYFDLDRDLKIAAEQTKATTLLSAAWTILDDETHPLFIKIKDAVDTFSHAELGIILDTSAVRSRLKTFAREVETTIESLEAKETHGMVLNIEVPILPSTPAPRYPEVVLLDEQRKQLITLIKLMGRKTGEKSWSEWFKEKFATVKNSIPTLMEMGAWSGLSAVINKLLNAGLIGYSIIGHSGDLITFGANVVTPWQATIKFPEFMKKQLVLYRLKEYGEKELKLSSSTSKVMKGIQATISSIDWAAVKMAFQVTPFGLFISAYSGIKFFVLKAKPSVNAYYKEAKDLIDAADTIFSGAETNENKLAMLTILHLVGKPEKFVEIMTCHKDDAYSTLAGLMDF